MSEQAANAVKLATQRCMFGMTTDEANENIEALTKSFGGCRSMALMSILSDVQELIAANRLESARQGINVVKLGLFPYHEQEHKDA